MKNVTRRKKTGRKGSFLPLLLVMVLFAGGLGYGVTKWVVLPTFTETTPPAEQPLSPFGTAPLTQGSFNDAGEAQSGEGEQPPQSPSETAPPQAVEPGVGAAEPGSADDNPSAPSEQLPLTGEALVYAIQFGSYSTYEGAQEAALDEVSKGRTVRIVEKDGSYKIVGSPYTDRTEAERALAAISPEGEDGLFITTMEVLTQ